LLFEQSQVIATDYDVPRRLCGVRIVSESRYHIGLTSQVDIIMSVVTFPPARQRKDSTHTIRREVDYWLNAVFILTDSVRGVGLGNLGRIGEVHESLHFAVLDRPDMHQRKIKTLTRSGHRCTISTDHDHFVILCDEFVGP
jgi:hypothetical protein